MSNGVYPGQQYPSAVQAMAWYAVLAAAIALISVGAKAVTSVIETVETVKATREKQQYVEQPYPEEYP